MTEFGLYSDEGLVEGQFYSPEEAEAALRDRYDPEDGLKVRVVEEEDDDGS